MNLMAHRGRPLSAELVRQLRGLHWLRYSISLIARHLRLSRTTVYKYLPGGHARPAA